MKKSSVFNVFGALFALICAVITVPFGSSIQANAEESNKVVRVGWFETPLDKTDKFGRKVGYNYEYQCKVAAYTDWTYEYVNGSWPELMQMLMDGDLDLMADVSFVQERTEYMLYSSSPMGWEDYYLFIAADNKEYRNGDYSYFNGKKIGVNAGSVQIGFFNDWASRHDIHAELIELTGIESESVQKLVSGEFDAYIAIDSYGENESIVPIVKVGSSEFYFAVNKNRHDLLEELDSALSHILDEDPNYNQYLYDKYYRSVGANKFMDEDELNWLSAHGKIKVGYHDDYLAYCAKDKSTGQLTGALKDFLEIASDCLANAHLDFEPVSFSTSSEAIEALKKGDVDCIFPVNFGNYEAEQLDLDISRPMITAELNVIVRNADKGTFFDKENVNVSIVQGDLNYNSVIKDLFPDWQVKEYQDMTKCLEAVSSGKVDCFLISNYRYNNIVSLCESLGLSALKTNKNTGYCFAVAGQSKDLYAIIGKMINLVPESSISAALTRYYADESRMGFGEYIRRNPLIIVAAVVIITSLVVIIIAQNRIIIAKRRANHDALTGLRNRHAYLDEEEKLNKAILDHPQFTFAITVFDVNDLKKINDEKGHHAGDLYLQGASKVICDIFKHSAVFRIGGDEFAAISQGEDFENINELVEKLNAHNEEAMKQEDGIVIAFGTSIFEGEGDAENVFEKADQDMYENKKELKAKGQ